MRTLSEIWRIDIFFFSFQCFFFFPLFRRFFCKWDDLYTVWKTVFTSEFGGVIRQVCDLFGFQTEADRRQCAKKKKKRKVKNNDEKNAVFPLFYEWWLIFIMRSRKLKTSIRICHVKIFVRKMSHRGCR